MLTDDTMHSHVRVEVNGVVASVTGTNRDSVGNVNGLYGLTYQSATEVYMVNILFDQVSSTSRNIITLTLRNITNPPDNRVLTFTARQHEIEVVPTRIYGLRELSYSMTKLNPIYVYSGVRNITKIGTNISLTLDIETSATLPDQMLIRLSTMQVLVREGDGYSCLVCIDGDDCTTSGINSVQA